MVALYATDADQFVLHLPCFFDEQIRPEKMEAESLFIFSFNSEIHPPSILIGPEGLIKVGSAEY